MICDIICHMTLASHAVAGAATALILRGQPELGAAGAFLSHFLLDAIPHWHYQIAIRKGGAWREKRLAWDADVRDTFARTGADSLTGAGIALVLAFLVSPENWFLALLGAGLGVLPDLLQFLKYLTRSRRFIPFERLHQFCHTKLRLDNRPILGPAIEVLAIFTAAGLTLLSK